MAERHSFWIIVAGTTPTSFRARRSEDLLPTLRQLQRTQPDTVLRWFERGRLWDSPEAAEEEQIAHRRTAKTRQRDWRPGGDHADPRARFKLPRDEKRARFKQRQRRPPIDRQEPSTKRPWDRGPRDQHREHTAERSRDHGPPRERDQGQHPEAKGPTGEGSEPRRGPGQPLGGWTPDRSPRPGPGGRPPFKSFKPFKKRPPGSKPGGGWQSREPRGERKPHTGPGGSRGPRGRGRPFNRKPRGPKRS
jgi:hypothetical protein